MHTWSQHKKIEKFTALLDSANTFSKNWIESIVMTIV